MPFYLGSRKSKMRRKSPKVSAKSPKPAASDALADKKAAILRDIAPFASDAEVIRDFVYVVQAPSRETKRRFERIKKACEALGLVALTLADVPKSSTLELDLAHTMIEQADFIVFDLSVSTSGIMYQAGYAYGVGNDKNAVLALRCSDKFVANPKLFPYELVYTSIRDLQKITQAELAKKVSLDRANEGSLSEYLGDDGIESLA